MEIDKNPSLKSSMFRLPHASTGTMLRVQSLATNSKVVDIDYNVHSGIISMVSFSINN